MSVNFRKAVAAWVVGLVWSVLPANAETTDHPYTEISRLNPFALRPVPLAPVSLPPVVTPPPRTEPRITGLTDLLGRPVAILEFTDPQTRRTERPPFFRAGDVYKDGFTIVAIDLEHQFVRVNQGGVETVLDFVHHGIKEGSSASAAPGSASPRLSPPAWPPSPDPRTRGVSGPFPPASVAPPVPPPAQSRQEFAARLEEMRALYLQSNDPRARLLPPANLVTPSVR